MYFPPLKICVICMYSTALVIDETFAKTAFAVVSCAVPGLSEFTTQFVFDLSTLGVRHSRRTGICRAGKLVIVKTFAQSRRRILQFWPPLFQGCVFYCLVFSISQPWMCAVAGEHLRSTARIQETFAQTVFAVVNSGDSKGMSGWAMDSRFLVGPPFGHPSFFLISRLSSFGWHMQ